MTRIAHSFRRRQDNIHLNALGQEIVDPEKESTGVESHDTSRLNRKLHGRHMQMIAIGGAIGTGLFIGSGSSLATGGPLGLLIGFGLVGLMLFFVVHALGELAVMFPISGTEIPTSF
jgi:amino acid permease